ncbi:MAG: hypothetical protein ABIL25_09390 [candidate division WOR-3 bacterium]
MLALSLLLALQTVLTTFSFPCLASLTTFTRGTERRDSALPPKPQLSAAMGSVGDFNAASDSGRRIPGSLADTLFSCGYYSSAVLEYKRCLYERQDTTGLVALKLGLALAAAGELGAATVQLHEVTNQHPTYAHATGMALAGLFAHGRAMGQARLALHDALLFSSDSAQRARLNSALAWLDLADGNASEAADYLEKSGNSTLANRVRLAAAVPSRSSAVAVLLSTVMPGAGEVYAGRPLLGLSSLLVTGGSALGTCLAARSDDWVLSAFLFSFLFLRFYSGSRRNAADLCMDYRKQLLSERFGALSRQYDLEPDWFAAAESLTGLRLHLPETESFPTR